ncbi:DUF819 family protein [Marinicella sp. S1101]|uniref:DUF819 family protein n=1 Tax=Marinicella marina TaxID=2996016 RepID=UPI0022609BD2|nr:DUF819 family protein [Marinicella marina]MCX7555064.1 DUF819 family protein [Marinicella marina]MDJ1141372.1 DUF819 family protein [Marinicella marina]
MAFTNNPIYVLTVICFTVILAVYGGKTVWGKKVGAALLVILIAAILANLKIIPSASNGIPLYSGIFKYVAPIAIFYLLLNVNIRSIKQAGLPMIGLFLLGSMATTLGILLAWTLLSPGGVFGADGEIIAGMLTGTYTGGSVNFNAVALEFGFQEKGALYAGVIAVDNVVTTLWIMVTLAMPVLLNAIWPGKKNDHNKAVTAASSTAHPGDESIDLESLMWLLFLGLGSFFLAELFKMMVPQVPSILTLSTMGILLAQTQFVSKLKGSHNLGLYLVFIFLAVIGAHCELSAVVALKDLGLTLLAFTALAVLLHGVVITLLGGLLYRDWQMIAIVSQANIGGGTTAIALAETFKRQELVLPAILVGTLGNALGTYLGFLVIYIL